MTDNNLLKEIRQLTGAGVLEIKQALAESGNSKERALEFLRKKGAVKLAKKAARAAKEGLVASYIHAGSRIGVLLEINSETDFVARTQEFKDLAKELALHIAGANPLYVSIEDVPAEVVEKEKEIYREQAGGKPKETAEKMIQGRLEKFYQEVCLLEQAYVKDPQKKVKEVVAEAAAKMGENVVVRRFARFAVGN